MPPTTNKSPVISISPREASLRRKIRRQLHTLGFDKSADGTLNIGGHDKDLVRRLHGPQRADRLSVNSDFVAHHAPRLLPYFASGRDLEPAAIQPVLERVYAGTWQADLFRLATLTWSVPVSNGFGRRLRYVIWDAHNDKQLGVLAIGDPVFNLSVRDAFIGWGADDRRERLVNVMDAYVLGALPPYNSLLGGKMVACLLRSRQVYNEFTRTYGNRTGIISGKAKNPRLLAVTTSSSMGRSSVYNRLKLGDVHYFEPVGYTRGWGRRSPLRGPQESNPEGYRSCGVVPPSVDQLPASACGSLTVSACEGRGHPAPLGRPGCRFRVLSIP